MTIPAALSAFARAPFLQALAISLALFAGFEPFRFVPEPPVSLARVRVCKAVHARLQELTEADAFCERRFFPVTELRQEKRP